MTEMKPKKEFLLIYGTIFPFDVLITTAPLEKIFKYMERYDYKFTDIEKENLEMQPNGEGRTVILNGGQTIIRLKPKQSGIKFLGNLTHEISHAVYFIMNRIGVEHFHGSDEVFAYYQAYLLKQALYFYAPLKLKKNKK